MEYTEEREQALKNFREDVLKSLTELQREIQALRHAAIEGKLISEVDLNQRIRKLQERAGSISEHYAQTIRPAHEVL